MVWAFAPVAVLVATTTALGMTAPELSVIKPVIVPSVDCASVDPTNRANETAEAMMKRVNIVTPMTRLIIYQSSSNVGQTTWSASSDRLLEMALPGEFSR